VGIEDSSESGRLVVPLAEEEAHVLKRSVSKGKVQVRTVVETFDEIAAETLGTEDVEVVRVPVGRVVTEAPDIRTDGEVTIVPVLEEIMIVEKQLVLREELHIRRHVTTEAVEIPITLRKQRAVVQRLDSTKIDTNEE
jgi:stress response protein YsnF